MSTPTATTTTISFSLTVPTTLVPVIAEAFAATYGYQATLPDGTANPVTPEQFTQQCVVAYIANVVESYQANQAAQAAAASALAAAKQQTAQIT